MQPALLVRFHPAGPWRIGPDSGARDQVDFVLPSDALYAALSDAMARLGLLEEWLAAIFGDPDGPAVRLSSCFPFAQEQMFAPPPLSCWPPAPSAKVRWKGARFVPVGLVSRLVEGESPEEDRWRVDGASRCLAPASWGHGPFRKAVRYGAAVDRLGGGVEPYAAACLEFYPGAGMWALFAFAGPEQKQRWEGPLRAALRLLGDSGVGGERSRGWGRSERVEFVEGTMPELVLPGLRWAPAEPPASQTVYWLLSLCTPHPEDAIDWSGGCYALATRGGRAVSPSGRTGPKKLSRMLLEGSALLSAAAPRGMAYDVAPDGFPHPVYRAGFALSAPIPWREAQR